MNTRHLARGSWLLAFSAALVFGASAGCAGESSAHKPCPSEAWVGKCTLRDLRKVEEREMPMPYVVYEATYSPQANAEYPQFTPAEVRLRFGTPARHEFELVDHVKPQSVVTCHAASTPGTCYPQDVVADVVPFDPDHAVAAAAPVITGCAAIDASSEQDRLSRVRTEGKAIREQFAFGIGSAEISPEATATARDVAALLAADPNLECLGLVGKNFHGEAVSLGDQRARAVKQLLISLGVDSRRLLPIALTAEVMAPGAQPDPVDRESGKVTLRVLLQTKPAQ